MMRPSSCPVAIPVLLLVLLGAPPAGAAPDDLSGRWETEDGRTLHLRDDGRVISARSEDGEELLRFVVRRTEEGRFSGEAWAGDERRRPLSLRWEDGRLTGRVGEGPDARDLVLRPGEEPSPDGGDAPDREETPEAGEVPPTSELEGPLGSGGRACPRCGAEAEPGAARCPRCYMPLRAGVSETPSGASEEPGPRPERPADLTGRWIREDRLVFRLRDDGRRVTGRLLDPVWYGFEEYAVEGWWDPDGDLTGVVSFVARLGRRRIEATLPLEIEVVEEGRLRVRSPVVSCDTIEPTRGEVRPREWTWRRAER